MIDSINRAVPIEGGAGYASSKWGLLGNYARHT